MGIANYESAVKTGTKCSIDWDKAWHKAWHTGGFTVGTTYTGKITTDVSGGLGFVWKAGANAQENSGSNAAARKSTNAFSWTATGDSVAVHAICAVGSDPTVAVTSVASGVVVSAALYVVGVDLKRQVISPVVGDSLRIESAPTKTCPTVGTFRVTAGNSATGYTLNPHMTDVTDASLCVISRHSRAFVASTFVGCRQGFLTCTEKIAKLPLEDCTQFTELVLKPGCFDVCRKDLVDATYIYDRVNKRQHYSAKVNGLTTGGGRALQRCSYTLNVADDETTPSPSSELSGANMNEGGLLACLVVVISFFSLV